MKQIIKNYSFNAAARTVTFNDFTGIELERVLLITNVTTNEVIYIFNTPSRGGSASGNVLTLEYDTSAMSNGDKLQITYDCAEGDPMYGASLHATVSGKHNAAPLTLSDGQNSNLQLDPSGNLKVALATRLDSTNDSVIATPLGHSYTHITAQTTTVIKSGAGILHGIDFTATASGVITVYDNNAGSGSVIRIITSPATLLQSEVNKTYDIAFSTGLTIVTSGANQDIVVSWR
ncbi:MAG TPA: hypothetical protein VFT16_00340 [Candidatus Saccharimonadales bacterium]|nr:hypothetical protein [Candidatus Saccharimonadales bacterium]